MPHQAAASINHWLNSTPVAQTTSQVLNGSNATLVSHALSSDTTGLFYTASLTFTDALKGIERGYFSWAIVKLYYSAFYSVRSLLGSNLWALFYRPLCGTPFSLRTTLGESPRKEKGVTHKVVWSILKRELPNSGLLGTIGAEPAHEWLMNLREEANYRNAKFPDPTVPNCLSALDQIGIARALLTYSADKTGLYAFDPDHAIIAFPLLCLARARLNLVGARLSLDAHDEEHLANCIEDCGLPRDFLSRV